MAVEAFAYRPSRPVNYFRAPSTGKLSTEFARGQVASQSANCFPIEPNLERVQKIGADNDLVEEGGGQKIARKKSSTLIADRFGRFACSIA